MHTTLHGLAFHTSLNNLCFILPLLYFFSCEVSLSLWTSHVLVHPWAFAPLIWLFLSTCYLLVILYYLSYCIVNAFSLVSFLTGSSTGHIKTEQMNGWHRAWKKFPPFLSRSNLVLVSTALSSLRNILKIIIIITKVARFNKNNKKYRTQINLNFRQIMNGVLV